MWEALYLPPSVAPWLILASVAGGWVNIPVQHRGRPVAINVGGCGVPCALAWYELVCVACHRPDLLIPTGGCCVVCMAVCYMSARPAPRRGVAMPILLPALVATVLARLVAPDHAPPVAFVTGVTGPLIGADVLHLRDMTQADNRQLSIGGAGPLDGIVWSGITAALLS